MNSFYASCERLFRPELRTKPVVVLSNNDGCIVALTKDAKKLGFKRGTPYFKARPALEHYGVAVCSSNYELYQSVSDRIARILDDMVPEMERYSIDEVFCDLTGMEGDLTAFGASVRARIGRWVGIPCCVGIAPTKTLAKLCDHFAKTFPVFGGVVNWCELTEARRRKALSITDVKEVWGVGGKTAEKLAAMGVKTALDFYELPSAWVRQRFNVVLERTHRELHGLSCMPLEPTPKQRLQICRSRSFGELSRTIEDVEAAIAAHVGEAASQMRRDGLKARRLTVFFGTDFFREDLEQDWVEVPVDLGRATADTLLLTKAALTVVKVRWKASCRYKKAGVILSGFVEEGALAEAGSLFDAPGADAEVERRENLMKTMDQLNARYGRGTIQCVAAKLSDGWLMKRDHLSRCCLTRLEDMLKVG